MGTFSPFHWIIVLAMAVPLLALFIVPLWRILQRAGFNGALSLLMFVPIVNMLLLWFVAFSKWPSDRDGKTSTSKGWIAVGVAFVLLAALVPVLMSVGAQADYERAVKATPGGQGSGQRDQFGGELVNPAR
ncbi:hypothetical protein [Acidovorax sp. LjRoot117]|uniref:hypothetical protein n=1 Tax=Acidovorax sp. LjRoot117 TaxID=3342255 RepID=UPI003ECEAD5F